MESWQYLVAQMGNIGNFILLLNALIHIIFAGAVAKDAGLLLKQGHQTYLVSGLTWAFATLIGGVFIAAVYWFMHHLKFVKNP